MSDDRHHRVCMHAYHILYLDTILKTSLEGAEFKDLKSSSYPLFSCHRDCG